MRFVITCRYPVHKGNIVKVLCGRDSLCVEFTDIRWAANIKAWKTHAGAQKFLSDRPGFTECRNAVGGIVVIQEVKS